MTELERHALMGDAEAQKECTEKGIVLHCPFCGQNFNFLDDLNMVYHTYDCCIVHGLIPLPQWNTRSAPTIGRCGECKHWDYGDCYRLELSRPNDYCSYFEPKQS